MPGTLKLVVAFSVGLFLPCCSRPHVRPELEGVYRSARAVEASLAVGVTLSDFSSLIREMSTQLLLARDQQRFAGIPDPPVGRLLDKYAEILQMYQDSGNLWQCQIQPDKGCPEASLIRAKYSATVYDPDALRQIIWTQASKAQETQIRALFTGIESPRSR